MKSLGCTKGKINKEKNGENVPHLEITELILQDSRVLYIFSK